MKALLRRDDSAVSGVVLIIIAVVLVAVLLFSALYVMGFFSQSVNQNCPPSVCGLGAPTIHIQVDVTGQVVANIGAPPSIGSGTLALSAVKIGTPAAHLYPPFILDETSTVSGTLTVTYPNGDAFNYDLPSQQGTNNYNFDLQVFLTGTTGVYKMQATVLVQQTGCWLGCAPGAQTEISGSFTLNS